MFDEYAKQASNRTLVPQLGVLTPYGEEGGHVAFSRQDGPARVSIDRYLGEEDAAALDAMLRAFLKECDAREHERACKIKAQHEQTIQALYAATDRPDPPLNLPPEAA